MISAPNRDTRNARGPAATGSGFALRLTSVRALVELLLGTAVAAMTSQVLQFPIARLGLSEPSQLPEVAAAASAAVLLTALFAAVLLVRGGNAVVKLAGTWVALSAVNTLVLAWPLESTQLYYGGSTADQAFRLQYFTRLSESPVLADMNYQGVAPFYPAGWFWLGGRFANLTGTQPWAAFKPFAVMTIAVAAVVAFTLWSVVVRRRVAVLLAVATTISGFLQGFDEPYAWMSAAWLPPVAVIGWHVLRRGHRLASAEVRALAGVGAFLGFAAITYTLYLGFATLVLVVMAAVTVFSSSADRWRTTRLVLGRLVVIGAVAGGVALLVWMPFVVARLGGTASHGVASRYLPEDSLLPFPMLRLTVFGLLCLAGFAWLVLAARRSEIAQALLVVVGSIYLWYALSTMAIAVGGTLLAFRLSAALAVALAVAGVFALLDVWRWSREKVAPHALLQVTALAFLLGLGGALLTVQDALTTNLAHAAQPAYDDYYPTGVNSRRQSDPAQPGAWQDDLAGTIRELTHREPSGLVLLSAYPQLLSYRPYWGFQAETPHYANPIASFDERASEVRNWASARGPAELKSMLDSSRFGAPEVFVLRRSADGLHVSLSYDAFPHQPNVQVYDVAFREELFSGPGFARRDAGPFTVIARTR